MAIDERSLTLELHAPGMTLMHRAGLGGLAATLKAMERAHKQGRIPDEALPQGPDLGRGFPWQVEPIRLALAFGEPEAAKAYLEKLFTFAFDIKDQLIDLPGTHRDGLSRGVRAELHNATFLTFLQHGRTRTLDKQPTVEFFSPDGDEAKRVGVEYRAISAYKHRSAAADLVDKSGKVHEKAREVIGPLNPGAVVRHNAFAADTKIEQTVDLLLPLYFSLVGCVSLSINRGSGVLLAPDVIDLSAFAEMRPRMTPTSPRECRIAGASDAALQMIIRLRTARLADRHVRSGIAGVYAMQLAPTPWATQQKSRVFAVHVPAMDESGALALRQFDVALRHLAPRIRSRTARESTGRGKKKVTTERTEWFWIDSMIRPLIADNLATGNRWYHDFTRLMRERETHQRIQFETKGLQAMADEPELTDDAELQFIRALHRAIHMARGKIYDDTMGSAAKATNQPNQATKNRWNRFMESLRLSLVGAKTQSQTQGAISEILARTGIVNELQEAESLRRVKDLVFGDDWRRARDLALFALASYKRPAKVAPIPGDPEGEPAAETNQPEIKEEVA